MIAGLPLIAPSTNAPITLPCGAFSSTLIQATSESFAAQINCPTNAIARCIAWIVNPVGGVVVNEDDLEIKANFWSYANNANVAQDGNSPIIVQDDVSAEGSCQRIISFPTLPKTAEQIWNARCSYTGDTGVCTLIFNVKRRQFPMIISEMYPIQLTLAQVQAALADAPTDPDNALPPIVPISNAPIIPFCGEFSSAIINPTFASFDVQITCPANAIARCIAWIVHPRAGKPVYTADLETNANFWSYSHNDRVKQYGVRAPIIVKDAGAGLCQRVIPFSNLPTDRNPEWDVLCSYTGYPGVCTLILNDELPLFMCHSLKCIQFSQHYHKYMMH